jgi:hypothetical protein
MTIRPMMTIALTLALAGMAAAQPATATTTTTTAPTPATATAFKTESGVPPVSESEESSGSRHNTREQFSRLLGRHPDELTRLLVLDPTLLNNEPFLAKYPELAQFLTEHPEIRRNPHYYLQGYEYQIQPPRPRSAFQELAEALAIIFVTGTITFALVWLIRTLIEQKRWTQLAKRQSEVHGRILDRLASSDELLAYMKTPAGTKYLESAPIALHAAPPGPSGPLARVMWSIQIGIVVAAGGLGLLLVSTRSTGDAEQGFFAMGAVAFCVGAGFLVSAFVSLFVSRRLGLTPENGGGTPAGMADEPGTVR